jgi:hypothetical protein
MNTFMNGLKNATNFTYTQNGALTHKTTNSALLDMFAQGAAMRRRSDEDCILMFKKAYEENPVYALKCLFYIRDIREGQGERRFFRVCMKWLAENDPAAVYRNLRYFAEYGRWDDLFVLIGSRVRNDVLALISAQLFQDLNSETPSLLAKWMPSANTSSEATKDLANDIRTALGMTPRQYRKMLSTLRGRIKVLERTMSANQWADIEFDKIPSVAGKRYRKAFARHDVDRAKSEKPVVSYADFAKDTTTKVNADVLNPVDIANDIFCGRVRTETDRAVIEKYWLNLKDYYHGREERGIAICDVSGSMRGQPLNAAVSMSAYIAERGKGPFKDHFITFSNNPELIRFEGVDIVDKFLNAARANWGGSTNVEAAMDLMLDVACRNNVPVEDMPTVLYIFSDMEFNACMSCGPTSSGRWDCNQRVTNPDTLFETIEKRWNARGYQLPRVIFWNLNALQENIPALNGRFSYVSGFSMNMVDTIFSGKDGYDLMMEVLDSDRYADII